MNYKMVADWFVKLVAVVFLTVSISAYAEEQVADDKWRFVLKPLYVWFLTLGVFSRDINGRTVEISEIDVYGNTSERKLERMPQYPHVFWMVWSHWYPQTRVKS